MRMKLSVIASLLVAGMLFPATAQAVDDCVISATGPDSTNECIRENTCDIDIDNDTDISIGNENDQNSTSGDANLDGNTSGGSASSGGASNQNGAVFELEVVNGNDGLNGCEASVVPASPTAGNQDNPPSPVRAAGQVQGANVKAGGIGGGQQVEAPVGGVSAGAGNVAASSVLAASLAAIAFGAKRLRDLSDA